jgi:hypothetical protein
VWLRLGIIELESSESENRPFYGMHAPIGLIITFPGIFAKASQSREKYPKDTALLFKILN